MRETDSLFLAPGALTTRVTLGRPEKSCPARYLRRNANLACNLSLSRENDFPYPYNPSKWHFKCHGTMNVAYVNKSGIIDETKMASKTTRNANERFLSLSLFSCYDTCNSSVTCESSLSLGNPFGIAAREEIDA